jgi:hypothetical protein
MAGLAHQREASVQPSRYFVILAAVWMSVMAWRLYPHFGDALKVDGRLMTFAEYLEDRCGQRIGPAADSCIAEAEDTGRRLVAREQGRSLLLIEAPLLGYLLVYAPLRYAARLAAAARRRSR